MTPTHRHIIISTIMVALLAVGCASPKLTTATPTLGTAGVVVTAPSSATTSAKDPNEDAAIIATARKAASKTLAMDYHKIEAWKADLLALSSPDGKRFWEQAFPPLVQAIAEEQIVVESVAIQRVEIQGRQMFAGIPGAFVGVSGVTTGTRKGEKKTDSFLQRFVLVQSEGVWQLLALMPTEQTVDPAIIAGAHKIATAWFNADYRNPDAWKAAMLAVSSPEGKKNWERDFPKFRQSLVDAQVRTGPVTVQGVEVQGKNADGTIVVTVYGQFVVTNKHGKTTVPLADQWVLAPVNGEWLFVRLANPPSELATPAPKK